MNAPELVLADEPTGNLDRESADRVMQLLTDINSSDGTGFLISTHDEKIAARCRRQVHMVDGRIADSGQPLLPNEPSASN
jgi:lipoprotein-releasing system ATP-binding protein